MSGKRGRLELLKGPKEKAEKVMLNLKPIRNNRPLPYTPQISMEIAVYANETVWLQMTGMNLIEACRQRMVNAFASR